MNDYVPPGSTQSSASCARMRLRAILFYDRRDIPCERWVCVRERVHRVCSWNLRFQATTWSVGKPHYRWMTRR